MLPAAVTFDFHNTLACCDHWFDLEVRNLAPAFLEWHLGEPGALSDEQRAEAVAAYRVVRQEIIDSGVERDASVCLQEVLTVLGFELERTRIDQGIDQLMNAALASCSPQPGAVETVRAFTAAGVPLAVVSSAAHHDFIEWSLTRFGVRSSFRHIISSASCGIYKSNPEIYRETARRLAAEPSAVVHVGDSHRYDVVSASRAGLRTVWLNWSGEPEPEPRADWVVERFSDLPPLLLGEG
jgi:HAD superfamily hydrolase (TIGR01509 family)